MAGKGLKNPAYKNPQIYFGNENRMISGDM
jgi:hypothetical protein